MIRTQSQLAEARRNQRSHAKKRFEQRFGLKMNRGQIHEIEKKIAGGCAILAERRLQTKNYLVEVANRLIAVGYNPMTKRIVTALPDDYLNGLPAELLHMARYKLLGDEGVLIEDITSGNHCTLIYRKDAFVSYYLVRYPGLTIKTGYNRDTRTLVPFVPQPEPGVLAFKMAPRERFEPVTLTIAKCEQIRDKIRNGESRFLWRYSDSLKFHEVDLPADEIFRVGYASTNGTLYAYEDPCEAD